MKGYNCIIVYSMDSSQILFCKRKKDPYKGMYNLVGGKIEDGEDGFTAAYRELWEETGIEECDIELYHKMDFTYYNEDCLVEVYAGTLKREVVLKEEANPLFWLSIEENFFDLTRFAGEGNIGHMVVQVREYGMGAAAKRRSRYSHNGTFIGVDGCRGGWIGAVLQEGELTVKRYPTVAAIMEEHSEFNEFLIDMIMGLQGDKTQVRPEAAARSLLKERSSTLFPAPARQAVYAENTAGAYEENVRILGKKFTPLTVGIIPKIRELDEFLQANPKYKNVLKESHPEICFSILKGGVLRTKKSESDGIKERSEIIRRYLRGFDEEKATSLGKTLKCKTDDILDAVCLAIAANLTGQGHYSILPEKPMMDDTGLYMRLIVPVVS